jgi:nitroreductase
MDFFELVASRRSVRRFQPREIEQTRLERLLGCMVAAPSAGNLQPYRVAVVQRPAVREAIARAALGQRFLAQAPVVLVFLQDPDRSAGTYGSRGAELYVVQDTAIACCYAQLAAAALGLGACWVGAFDPAAVARAVGAPAHLVPAALLALGYPDEDPAPTGRLPLQELVWREHH